MNVREELKAYYDNELTPAQAEEVRRLLDGDPRLAAEYEQIGSVSQYLRTHELKAEPYGLEATLGALTVGKAKAKPLPFWVYAFAGVLVLFLFGVLFPVFAQSKNAAKATAMMAQNRAMFKSAQMDASLSTKSINGAADGGVVVESGKPVGGFAPPSARESRVTFAGSARDDAPQAQQPATPPTSDLNIAPNALVVKNGQMQLEVVSVDDAQQRIEGITRGAGGFIESANRQDADGLANVNMTLRVPVVRFESVLREVRNLGKVLSQSFSGEDVTAQVVDTDARLKTLRSEEQQYVTLMSRANKIGEVLAVKERITQVREEIESLDAQQRSLRSQARMSTLSLEIHQRPKPVPPPVKHATRSWSENAWARGLDRLSSIGTGLGTMGIYLLVFSPVWLPLGLIGWMAYRKYRM